MFDEFVKQVKRLFSSQKNGAKGVSRLTDRLHMLKLLLLVFSIMILISHTQFREDFHCQGQKGATEKAVTRFCLMNGTTTTVAKTHYQPHYLKHPTKFLLTHTGMGFAGDETQSITHNYMRSLWLVLVVLVVLSFLPMKHWSHFVAKYEVLRGLLKSGDHEELQLVKHAEAARHYERLMGMSADIEAELGKRVDASNEHLPRSERVSRTIALLDTHLNIYNPELDYHSRFLLHVLLTGGAFKQLSAMKLRRHLIVSETLSLCASLAQFLLPLFFISPAFFFFGLNYLDVAMVYVHDFFFSGERAYGINAIDYELSSHIFPIMTQCEYKQVGYSSTLEKFTTPCTVSINEISSKLYACIWWLVVISILVGLYHFCFMIIGSLSSSLLSFIFSKLFWPGAKKQADFLAKFPREHARLQRELKIRKRALPKEAAEGMLTANATGSQQIAADDEELTSAGAQHPEGHGRSPVVQTRGNADSSTIGNWRPAVLEPRRKPLLDVRPERHPDCTDQESDCDGDTDGDHDDDDGGSSEASRRRRLDKKRLEAEEGRSESTDGRAPRSKPWYECCPKDVGLALKGFVQRLTCSASRRRIRSEAKPEMNIYYVLYLLYLGLGRSKSKIEEVIRNTALAAQNRIDDLQDELVGFQKVRSLARQGHVNPASTAPAQGAMVENLLRTADTPEVVVAVDTQRAPQEQTAKLDESRPLCNLV